MSTAAERYLLALDIEQRAQEAGSLTLAAFMAISFETLGLDEEERRAIEALIELLRDQIMALHSRCAELVKASPAS